MIYFDNASTTLLCDKAKEILQHSYGNASSPHDYGIKSERLIKSAVKDIASVLSCKSNEIIFTSGGTESNNLGIMGAAFALKSARGKDKDLHIMANKYEHPSVIGPLNYLASLPGFYVSSELTENTALICISHVNSETGDIAHINKPKGAILFVDGAQAFCKIKPPNNADIYSFSGHKIHAPMGIGGLYVNNSLSLKPILYGGGQQNDIRPGTENVASILAMATAAKHFKPIGNIKDILSEIVNEVPDAFINHSSEHVSPYILNISFQGLRGETLTSLLSSKGVYVSMGSACRTKKGSRSPLEEMGFNRERAESAIRLSFSAMNTDEEAYKAKEIIKASVAELRRL